MVVSSSLGLETELDPQIIEDCRRGDRDAFRVLFETFKDRVYTVALNFSGNPEMAHDITQDVFVKLFDSIRGFREEANFRTWLFRITVNACIDEQRRRKRFLPLSEFAAVLVARIRSQEVQISQLQVSSQIQSVIVTLAPRLRIPILLRYVEDLSYGEIAEVLNCSIGTVSSRISRGHKLLAQRLSHLRGTV